MVEPFHSESTHFTQLKALEENESKIHANEFFFENSSTQHDHDHTALSLPTQRHISPSSAQQLKDFLKREFDLIPLSELERSPVEHNCNSEEEINGPPYFGDNTKNHLKRNFSGKGQQLIDPTQPKQEKEEDHHKKEEEEEDQHIKGEEDPTLYNGRLLLSLFRFFAQFFRKPQKKQTSSALTRFERMICFFEDGICEAFKFYFFELLVFQFLVVFINANKFSGKYLRWILRN